jgi:putative lipoic acid-binding regulatory protein
MRDAPGQDGLDGYARPRGQVGWPALRGYAGSMVTGTGAPGGESPFQYPLRYPLKIIGLSADDFVAHARRLVEQAAGTPPEAEVEVRASGGGRYLSVTLVVRLDTEAQRLAIYAALKADGRVVYAL